MLDVDIRNWFIELLDNKKKVPTGSVWRCELDCIAMVEDNGRAILIPRGHIMEVAQTYMIDNSTLVVFNDDEKGICTITLDQLLACFKSMNDIDKWYDKKGEL